MAITRQTLGSMYYVEMVTGAAPPEDKVTWWYDRDTPLCLRPVASATVPSSHTSGIGKLYDGGRQGGVWEIAAENLCKVSSWVEGRQLESKTIAFVKERVPDLPITRVIYEWVDVAWNRTFMLMWRADGDRLDRMLPVMSPTQLEQVAADVAKYTAQLVQHTSPRLETVDGVGVQGQWLLGEYHSSATWPSWKPNVHPTYTRESLKVYLQKRYSIQPPDSGSEFCFYNADLHPRNIFVSIAQDKTHRAYVSEIIDWEEGCYWSRYWVHTCPEVNRCFLVEGKHESAWRDALYHQLKLQLNEGDFRDESSWWHWYR